MSVTAWAQGPPLLGQSVAGSVVVVLSAKQMSRRQSNGTTGPEVNSMVDIFCNAGVVVVNLDFEEDGADEE